MSKSEQIEFEEPEEQAANDAPVNDSVYDHENLMACPDCGSRISRRAQFCPDCGCPIEADTSKQTSNNNPEEVQTVELTAKKWKGIQLIGAFGCIASECVLFSAIVPGNETVVTMLLVVGGFGFLFSLLIFLYGRIGAWWYHG